MPALQIRDVPPEVRDALVQRARSRGQSLQAFLLSLVQAEAQRSRNIALLERFDARSDGSQLTAEQALDGLTQARSDRDERLGDGAA